MSSEYQSVTIGDVCDVGDGAHSKVERVSKGIPYLTSKNIKQGTLDTSKVDYISEGDFIRLFTVRPGTVRRPESGDVLMGIIGTFGNFYQYKESDRFGVSSAVAILRPRQEVVCPEYLGVVCSSNLFKSFQQQVKSGSVQGYTNISTIKTLPIPLPPLPDQKSIAHILGTLDDKIELNRKTNQTLEAMAKALFKSWFVDFDPVRAKVEGRPTGLPAAISDLFPDSFEDSELGEIPSGWSIGTIGNAVGEVFDGPHATPKEASDGYVFLGIKNMTGSSLDLSEKRWIGLDDWDQWTKRVVPTSGDIVFTYEAALGLFAVIPSGLTCCLGRRMALIRPRGDEPTPYFWFHQFIAEPFQRLIEERSIHGATVNRTPLTEFPQYPVLSAPIGIRNLFDSTASALWSRINLGSNETEKLASTRDALLPKLISGEIRIPDAEKMLEEVGV